MEAQPLPAGALVLVGCSGGADSLALTAAVGFVAPRGGVRAGAVVVDHGLQDGSAAVAWRAARQCRGLLPEGSPVAVERVQVAGGASGPEGEAREARYAALAAVAARLGAGAVLLGHTRDDQAEQVLLGLARGSGARSLAGMPSTRALRGAADGEHASPVLLGRPFLGDPARTAGGASAPGGHAITREVTEQVCDELGLEPWDDPHNRDERYARVRARRALRELEPLLGPGLGANLARTADLLRDDADALEQAAETAYLGLGEPPWAVDAVATLPRAIRTRLWRRCALALGSPGTDLTSEHLSAVDALVTAWHGQGPLHLPGGVRAGRSADRVWLRRET